LALGAAINTAAPGLLVLQGHAASQPASLPRVPTGTTVVTEQTSQKVFVQGTVISRTKSQLVLTNSRTTAQVINLLPQVAVWKESETTPDAILGSDFLFVSGLPGKAGAVDALRIWVNIGWYHGPITSVGAGWIRVNAVSRGLRTIYVTPLTLLFHGVQTASHYSGQLSVGQWVDGLGMFVPGADMRATRIWFH